MAAYNKEVRKVYLLKNKIRIAKWQKAYELKRRYNLTTKQYSDMLSAQNSCCKICNTIMNPPCVDHSHTTGKTRGLLCMNCNTSIGLLKENTNIINNLIKYIKEHNE